MFCEKIRWFLIVTIIYNFENFEFLSGRVRILIKIRLKVNFDRFTMEKMSNFIFNRILMSIRTRPQKFSVYGVRNLQV